MNYSDWSEDTKEKNRIRTLANYRRKAAAKRSAQAEKAMQERRRAGDKIQPKIKYCLECGAELPEGHHPVDYCDWREYRAHFKREYAAVEVPSLPQAERARR